MDRESYSVSEACRVLGVSPPTLKRMAERGQILFFRTPGGQMRFSAEAIEAVKNTGQSRIPSPPGPSGVLQNRREHIEELGLEAQELRARREIEKLRAENTAEAERRVEGARERETERQRRLEEVRAERLRQVRDREQTEAEKRRAEVRQEWRDEWLAYALQSVPRDAPPDVGLDVRQAVEEVLTELDPDRPHYVVERMVRAAVERALLPWKRRKETAKVVEEARNQIPWQARNIWEPSQWETRAMRAAAEAIGQLRSDASSPEIRAVALDAARQVRQEYERQEAEKEAQRKQRQAEEEHRRACEQMVQWVFDGDDAREAVRQALEKLPVGTTRAKMENARDAALAPFRAATRAAADADRYLQHVANHIEELGNEDTGEWDLGGWSERYHLATKLKAKLRPLLIQKLTKETLDVDEAHEFIEEWLEQELESGD